MWSAAVRLQRYGVKICVYLIRLWTNNFIGWSYELLVKARPLLEALRDPAVRGPTYRAVAPSYDQRFESMIPWAVRIAETADRYIPAPECAAGCQPPARVRPSAPGERWMLLRRLAALPSTVETQTLDCKEGCTKAEEESVTRHTVAAFDDHYCRRNPRRREDLAITQIIASKCTH